LPKLPNSVWTEVPQYADAQIDTTRGVLVCSTADEAYIDSIDAGAGFTGIYHSFDIPFYYYNLRQNAANRANIFLKK